MSELDVQIITKKYGAVMRQVGYSLDADAGR
jgi:hypothetical protein